MGKSSGMKLWAIKMLFVWRWRLGYWCWDGFKAAWTYRRVEAPDGKSQAR